MIATRGSGGKPFDGIHVTEHKFQGVSTLNQLEDYGLLRPTFLLSRKGVASLGLGSKGDQVAQLRDDIQRTWDKTRKLRAEVYSIYIERVECDGEDGGTPAITLYAPSVKAAENQLIVPYSGALVAIDGETQTEARYMLRDRRSDTGENPVAITVYHGTTIEMARQILHDYNHYAKPIPEGKLGSFSSTGAMSRAINEALDVAQINISQINRRGNLPGKKFVASYTQLMHFAAGYTLGETALGSNASKYFDTLNKAASTAALNHGVPKALGAVLGTAKTTEVVRQAPTQVWQCAGVKTKILKGSVNWEAGNTAYKQTMVRQRGGERIPTKDRLATIYAAL